MHHLDLAFGLDPDLQTKSDPHRAQLFPHRSDISKNKQFNKPFITSYEWFVKLLTLYKC